MNNNPLAQKMIPDAEVSPHLDKDGLLGSQNSFSEVIKFLPDATLMIDRKGQVVAWNLAMEKLSGIPADAMLGRGNYEYSLPFYGARRPILIDLVLQPSEKIERAYTYTERDDNVLIGEAYFLNFRGEEIYMHGMASPLRNPRGDIIGAIESIRNISKHKQAEEQLEFKNIILSTQQETSLDGILVVDNNNNIASYNHRFVELLDIPPDLMQNGNDATVLQLAADRMVNPEEFLNRVTHTYEGTEGKCREEISLKDGRVFDRYSAPMRGSNGRYYGRVWYFRDITERKQAEKELQASRRQLRMFLDASPDLYFLKDLSRQYLMVNKATTEFFGQPEENIIGKTDFELMPEVAARLCAITDSKAIEKKQTIISLEPIADKIYETLKFPVITNDEICGVAGIIRDVTQRKLAEDEKEQLRAQLNQAQKMESIGRLAGGIAHDYNNKLTVILGYTQIAMEETDPNSSVHYQLQKVLDAAQRSADITKQLLGFARKQQVFPKVLNLNETIEQGMLQMLRRLIGENIDLNWKPKANLWKVKIDASQLDQILANLCLNARDAIGGIGKITIKTDRMVLDETYCAHHPGAVPGQYAALSVCDDGCGIAKENLARLFEPFFTTKEVGKGTGLGLAMVYGIVKQNNGFIDVETKLDHGTTFTIYFPRHVDRVAQGEGENAVSAHTQRGKTVLVVEDEKVILDMARTMLQLQGYTVFTAASPNEALKLAQKHPGAIHLLMTDVIMPEMNGRELAARLQSMHTHLKLLYMSGYTSDIIAHHGVLEEGINFIQKPFSKEELIAKVGAILGQI